MLYAYVKAIPARRRKINFRFLSYGLVTLGIFFIINCTFPILVYQLKSLRFSRSSLVEPVENYSFAYESNDYVNYDDYENWFYTSPKQFFRETKITHYSLSIPKLGIENAVVTIGGGDLSKSLIHYPGTALPGEYGNAVVFGHSVLPQFFNPKNYKTIFSTLPTLKEGDEILIDFDGISYRYAVIKMVEVSPGDISVLEQRYNGEYLSLITCVPPGTYLRRLVVRAKLVRF